MNRNYMNSPGDDDYIVGKITALSMYIAMLFIMFQFVILTIIGLSGIVLFQLGIIHKNYENIFFIICLTIAESLLIIGIYFHLKKKYGRFELIKTNNYGQKEPFIFKESYLEWLISILSLGGILWIYIIGLPPVSIKIFLIIVDSFAILFFSIFFIVRLILTKVVSFTAAIPVALCVILIMKYIK